MKNSTKTTLVGCFTLIFVIGICLFSYAIIKYLILPKKQQVNLELNIMLPKDSQIAYATTDGTIWLGSPESKETYKLISGTGKQTLTFLSWSDSGNELFVIRQVDENYSLSVVDFSNEKVHLNILGPSTEYTWAISGTDPSTEPYICIGTDSMALRYFLNTSKTESISDSLSCDANFTLYEIPLDVLPEGIRYEVNNVPQSDHLLYVSDYQYGTFVYDTNQQKLINEYKEWAIDCWGKKDFFIAHKTNSHLNRSELQGIYKVNLDGSFELIVHPTPIGYYDVPARLPFCTPDGQMLFYWDIGHKDNDKWINKLYATPTDEINIETVWTLGGFYGGYIYNGAQPIWIPNSKNFLVYIPVRWGKGSLTLVDSNTLKVIPIAGSYLEELNINGISLISGYSLSPDGKWINFRGTTSGEYERDYLVKNDGTNLIEIASDRLAGTIACGSDWSPSSKFIKCPCVDDIQNNSASHLCFVDTTGKVVSEFINSTVFATWKPIH